MRKILTMLVALCIFVSCFALPTMAMGEISIKEVYFYSDGEEISNVKEGDISSKLVVSNSGVEKNVSVFIALYDEENNLEAVKKETGVIEADAIEQAIRVPAISVEDANKREIRVFLWESDNFGTPAGGRKILSEENAGRLDSITLYADGKAFSGTINPEAKEINFDFSAYIAGSNESAMPNLEDAYFEANGAELSVEGGVIDFSSPMTLISTGEGPTEKYIVKSKQYIVHKSDDFEGNRLGVPSERKAIDTSNGYSWDNPTLKVRPVSKSDEEDSGKALYFTHKNEYERWYADCTTKAGLNSYPKIADEIILSFDIRYDGFQYYRGQTTPFGNDIVIGQGEMYNKTNAPYAISFSRNSAVFPEGVDVDTDNQYVMSVFGGGTKRAKLNSPAMNMKQWYTVKQVFKINHATGDYTYDYYLDGKHIGTVKNGDIDTRIPNGKIAGDAVADYSGGVYNWYARTYGETGIDFYLDNVKVEYSYGNNEKNLFLIGDSLMSETKDTTSPKQGIGKYVCQHTDLADFDIINTARSGHQAKFYLEGGTLADGATYSADWHGIKTQLGSEDAVIVSIGANDWAYRGDKDEITANLKEIVGDAKKAGAKVLLVSETPDFDFDNGVFKQRTQLNECLENVAEYYDVPYADMGAEFEKEIRKLVGGDNTVEFLADQYYVGFAKEPADWTHLNDAGASLAAEILVGFIKEKIDFNDSDVDIAVLGATTTYDDLTFEGLVNPDTKEITFYIDSGKYAGLDEAGNVKVGTYIRDAFLGDYENFLKEAVVKIKTEASVDKAGVAQDFSNGPVTYKIGSENWKVSFIETNIQHMVTMNEGLLTREDRLDLPAGLANVGGSLAWESKAKDEVETSIISENGNNIFKFVKNNADANSSVFAFQNMQSNGVVKQVETTLAINSTDIKIDELDEKEGFYFGFSTSREKSGERQNLPSIENSKSALLFTRSGKQKIDDKISLKYVNTFTDKEAKAIPGAPELDFNKWYNIKTVQKSTENEGTYTVTTEVYIDNIYVGSYSSDYSSAIYRNIMIQFGTWNDSDTTFSIKLDNLKTSFITTASDVKGK